MDRDLGDDAIPRAAALLRALEHEADGLGVPGLALATGQERTEVAWLISALAEEGLVSVSREGRVRLGQWIARLGAASRESLSAHLRPWLVELHSELDETVDLAVLENTSVRFIDQIPARRRLAAASAVGVTFPLHCSANGKAMLASLPPERARSLLEPRLPRYTPNTITTRAELMGALEEVRRTGVAHDREEHTEGIVAIASVVRDASGPVAAISIPMPTPRFREHEPVVVRELLRVCRECSGELGAATSRRGELDAAN